MRHAPATTIRTHPATSNARHLHDTVEMFFERIHILSIATIAREHPMIGVLDGILCWLVKPNSTRPNPTDADHDDDHDGHHDHDDHHDADHYDDHDGHHDKDHDDDDHDGHHDKGHDDHHVADHDDDHDGHHDKES